MVGYVARLDSVFIYLVSYALFQVTSETIGKRRTQSINPYTANARTAHARPCPVAGQSVDQRKLHVDELHERRGSAPSLLL